MVVMPWRSLLAALAVSACGGSALPPAVQPPPAMPASAPVAVAPVADPVVVAPVADPVVVAAPVPVLPVASAPIGVVDLPPPSPAWVDLWREDWAAPALGGWVRHNTANCQGGQADQSLRAGASNVAPGAWADFGRVNGRTFAQGALRIDDTQTAGGWAMLGGTTFDPDTPLRLTGLVDLQPDDGAWLGLTLIQDESDYREIALYEDRGALRVGLWAPCYVRDLGPVALGPRLLALEYRPGDAWLYRVDGVLLHTELVGYMGAALIGRPRVGIYAVNIGAESRRLSFGRLRATIGPLAVSTGVR